MILDTITKGETERNGNRQMNQDRGNGQVTARTLRVGGYPVPNPLNPGGGQVDAGTIASPATFTL